MNYPRLPENLDLRRKLLQSDIFSIREQFEARRPYHTKAEISRRRSLGLPWNSERQALLDLAGKYCVSYHSIYYWVKDGYRDRKRAYNAESHSKANLPDYEAHRAKEIRNRAARFRRYKPQGEWHAVVSALNEKRHTRHTVRGKALPVKSLSSEGSTT